MVDKEIDIKAIEHFLNTMHGYMQMTREVIYPLDKVAYQAIDNIITMSMISFGRKHNLDYDETEQLEKKKQEAEKIENIMSDINDELEEELEGITE